MDNETFNVRVEGVRFSAAHFATFGGTCEPLHGHSYEVSAEVSGKLTDDSWVVDFLDIKSILRHVSAELDHKFMLQCESRLLKIDKSDSRWHISTPAGTAYDLPTSDVVPLPIDNSTAERLSQWFTKRLWQELAERDQSNIESVTVEVWEGPGQRASHQQKRLPVG